MTPGFEGATDLVESGFLLSLPSGIQSFVSDVRLSAVFQGGQFEYRQAYLICHSSLEVHRGDEACIWWFSYKNSIADVLDIPARDVTSASRNFDDVQVKRFVRSVPVQMKP